MYQTDCRTISRQMSLTPMGTISDRMLGSSSKIGQKIPLEGIYNAEL